ncbi:allograft inflammatory factor 1 [Trichuris trichiura]|uniref:Allograft inflammatory factor 1 n=1 Tax=Trichuris trichiura TaxID=36087 RepID=A0A077ZJ15_TRITR|nr:allograft inflammatory factor 1 [Trichuris trichiura]
MEPASPSQNGAVSLQKLSVGAALVQQFVNKLRSRNASNGGIRAAEEFIRGVRFQDYEERSSCRLMQFPTNKSNEVIERFCKDNAWDEESTNDLKFSAALLDADQKSDTFIRFQKVDDGEFYVHFIALKRMGEKIFFGLARHHVKFKLAPNINVTEKNSWAYKSWWQRMKPSRGARSDQSSAESSTAMSEEQATLLENFFLLRALKKFAEDTPSSVHELPYEDRQFLTFGSDFDF